MKPIFLEMHAFGPYGDRAEVDFEPLADVGLFVVSGPTGAGKSTIFDAICFALYGSLSGARSGHSDVRSHYAAPQSKCMVALVFDAEGQRWRITRQPSQTVQKVRGIGTTVQPATAVLDRWNGDDWEPDTSKVRDVTARCRDLVGLSLGQFERVVLLPQGKFAEVLNAKTSERSDLLRTLFGSEVFDRAAEILNAQAKESERSLQGVDEQRSVFHRRALDAIERIDEVLTALPAEMGVVVRASEGAGGAVDAQLSLLDDAGRPSSLSDNDDPATDLDAELGALIAGPIAHLAHLVDRRRADAETSRSRRDRAEAQRRAIDQRTETLRLLALLEAQAGQMSALAARTATARSLLGLVPAIADRDARHQHLVESRRVMDQLWERSLHLLPDVLSNEAHVLLDLDPSSDPTPSVVSDLIDRVANRSAALDRVTDEMQRIEQLRRELATVEQRLGHLDAIEENAQAADAASAAEVAALEEEEGDLQAVASTRAPLGDQIAVLDQLMVARDRADDASAELAALHERRVELEASVAVARAAIHGADEEIDALSVMAAEVVARRIAAEAAAKRCERRSQLDRAMEDLARSTDIVEAAKRTADGVFRSFVAQTAPRLAAELVDDEPCPVCGSVEHPAPAAVSFDEDDASIDAAAVEQASAAASAAEAEQTRWRTTIARLIEDDPTLSSSSLPQLESVRLTAAAALASAEDAGASRVELVASRAQLQAHLTDVTASLEQIDVEIASAQLVLREMQGALGGAVGRSRDDLAADRRAQARSLDRAEEAIVRIEWIRARRAEIAHAGAEASRLSRQRAGDRATAAERIAQLTTSITSCEAQMDAVLGGRQLAAMRADLDHARASLTDWQEQRMALARNEAAFAASAAACASIVEAAGFDDEADAVAVALPASTVEQQEAIHGRWSHELAAHRAALAALDLQELPDELPDLDQLTAMVIASAERYRDVAHVFTSIEHLVAGAQADLAEVASLDTTHARQRAHHETLQRVASVVRGQNSRRLSLENWVLSVYLHDVVEHANLHLATMSNGRYRLAVQDAPSSQIGQHGLDLVVDDAHTGRVRSSVSLSGGETFQASLALALGLADVVMLGRAGLHLDALFVDEGFGSLDADAIDQAITVLDGLRSRGSMVGVITHVEALKNALPVAIDVQPRSDLRGSEIRQVA